MVKIKKAIFFDRDGTIIKSYISKDKKPIAIKTLKECKIFPSVSKILNKLKKEYLIFLITNQPDVSRKKNTKENVLKINNFLLKKLPIKKIYTCYCENKKCRFRKPNNGMLIKASKKYKINLSKSFVVGDRWKDVNAGKSSKCTTIFINKKYNEKIRIKPDYYIKSFYQLKKIFKI